MSHGSIVEPEVVAQRWTAWDRFVAASPAAGFMQTSWWADFRTAFGFDHFAPIFRHEGEIVGGALVLRFPYGNRRCFYYIPEGPVLPGDPEGAGDIFQAVLDAVDARRAHDTVTVSHLRIEPRWTALPAVVRGVRVVPERDRCTEPRHTRLVDLRPSPDDILAQMKPKGRYNVRLAARHAVTVVEDPSPAGLEDFLRIYEDMAGRQRIPEKPPEYFEGLLALLQRARAGTLFFAELGGERLATALVVTCGTRCTYFYGASLDERREVMAPYALHFAIMQWAKALGLEWYDFWGVAPPGAVNHPWRHITEFKEKFGGSAVGLVPTLDLVYDAAAYQRYQRWVQR